MEKNGNYKDDRNDENLGKKHFKTKKKTSFKVLKQELNRNKEGEYSLCGSFRNRLRLTRKREKKLAQELEKEGLRSYNIKALCQGSQELDILSAANSHDRLGELPKLLPIDFGLPIFFLFDIFWREGFIFSKHKISINQ